MKSETVNPVLATFLKFVACGYYKVNDTIWTTGTTGQKKLTKSQLKSLEKTGIVTFNWNDDCIKVESHAIIHSVSPVGTVPYKKFVVEYE